MNTPTSKQLAGLPAWAREHITDLSRQREDAISALNKFTDSETPSAFYCEEHPCTGEESSGPQFKRHYIQTRRVICESQGLRVEVFASEELYGKSRPGIEIQWGVKGGASSFVAFVPYSFQAARIIPIKP